MDIYWTRPKKTDIAPVLQESVGRSQTALIVEHSRDKHLLSFAFHPIHLGIVYGGRCINDDVTGCALESATVLLKIIAPQEHHRIGKEFDQ